MEHKTARQPFYRGHGLWRIPKFLEWMCIDSPQFGLAAAARLNYRRLTIQRAARQLPPTGEPRQTDPIPVYLMSGRQHWPMTAFCAFTLVQSTRCNIVPVILDDGTLDENVRRELTRILPRARFLDEKNGHENVHRYLPENRFPCLHEMRRKLPLMRKLLDLHAGQRGWRLFLDSDMLFWSEPDWMLEWLRDPTHPVYMWDYQNSYGYSDSLMQAVLGAPMPPMVNTGFCGLRSDAIDWEQVERWATGLRAESTNHFSEQCLTAMIMATSGGCPAPRDYLIWPSAEESRYPTAKMHHYVAESRNWYYIYGLGHILRRFAPKRG
jgi:hypothetical protein